MDTAVAGGWVLAAGSGKAVAAAECWEMAAEAEAEAAGLGKAEEEA